MAEHVKRPSMMLVVVTRKGGQLLQTCRIILALNIFGLTQQLNLAF